MLIFVALIITMADTDYISINKKAWNERLGAHLTSEFYDLEAFIKGKNSLNSIELDLLGDVSGKSILHLQCHFGQDTLSLSRMGAMTTGVDLSDKAITKAKELNEKLACSAKFICCDVYSLPENLDEQFDIVFTSYGTIGWLPDIDKWATIVNRFLKPGGRFIFAEFHPVVWMFDDDFKEVKYRYFNDAAIEETEEGTYADKEAKINLKYVSWNHGLAEVLSSLVNQGLELKQLKEFDYSPYNCFSQTIEFEPGKYRIRHLENYIPMVYALEMKKA